MDGKDITATQQLLSSESRSEVWDNIIESYKVSSVKTYEPLDYEKYGNYTLIGHANLVFNPLLDKRFHIGARLLVLTDNNLEQEVRKALKNLDHDKLIDLAFRMKYGR